MSYERESCRTIKVSCHTAKDVEDINHKQVKEKFENYTAREIIYNMKVIQSVHSFTHKLNQVFLAHF